LRKLLRWTRLDQSFVEVLLLWAGGAVVVFGIVLPLLGVLDLAGGSTTRTVELDARASVPRLPAGGGVTLKGTHAAELSFRHPDVGQRLLLALPDLIAAALALVVVWQLARLVRTLRAGDPFVPGNARRLTVIALAVVVGGAAVPLATAITTDLLQRDTAVDGVVVFSASLDFLPFLIGFLVAALAEFFRRGAKLREETVGLV
jgi:DUF2975 family protein